jgi:hypothetical protein
MTATVEFMQAGQVVGMQHTLGWIWAHYRSLHRGVFEPERVADLMKCDGLDIHLYEGSDRFHTPCYPIPEVHRQRRLLDDYGAGWRVIGVRKVSLVQSSIGIGAISPPDQNVRRVCGQDLTKQEATGRRPSAECAADRFVFAISRDGRCPGVEREFQLKPIPGTACAEVSRTGVVPMGASRTRHRVSRPRVQNASPREMRHALILAERCRGVRSR